MFGSMAKTLLSTLESSKQTQTMSDGNNVALGKRGRAGCCT